MGKKTILFVDDEPNILDGLRRMLRSMRKDFELYFVDSGSQALQMMADKNFDIVVSDMRMPGMDGAQLLAEVKKISPHSIRIMLTGQADGESVLRTVRIVHQFLAKPCDPEKLKEILIRSSALHEIINNRQLKEIVTTIDTLPSIPAIYLELQDKIADPNVEISDIAKIIAKDVAMTAKILQLVNSSFFGLFQNVGTLERAVSLLGPDTIKSLVLGVKVFSDKSLGAKQIFVDELWRHSMVVGGFARIIAYAETGDKNMGSEAYFAGILHDIGKLILIAKLEKEYSLVFQEIENEKLTMFEAEKKVFNASHCEMGAYLIGLWGFQTAVVEAIGFHHKLEDLSTTDFTTALAIHVADVFDHQLQPETTKGAVAEFNMEYFKSTGFDLKIEKWRELCMAEYAELNP